MFASSTGWTRSADLDQGGRSAHGSKVGLLSVIAVLGLIGGLAVGSGPAHAVSTCAAGSETVFTTCWAESGDVEITLTADLVVTTRLASSGNARTIDLAGHTLTAQKGLQVIDDDALTINDSGTNGTLTINNVDNKNAAIGGNGSNVASETAGTVTINGGTVTATGGSDAAGIGGGGGTDTARGGTGGTVTINAGTVSATGGTYTGAGIGGGGSFYRSGGAGGVLTINGGTVTATGGVQAAGVGGGSSYNASGGTGGVVTVNAGTLTATGGVCAAGIGGAYSVAGSGSAGGVVTIKAGTVTATGGMGGGAGIGGGGSYYNAVGGAGGVVTVDGGTVTATGGSWAAGIGGGGKGSEGINNSVGGSGGFVTVHAGTVIATGGNLGAGIGGGSGDTAGGDGGTVAIDAGEVKATGGAGTTTTAGAGIGSGASAGAAGASGSLALGGSKGSETTQTTGGAGGSSTRVPSIMFASPGVGVPVAVVTPLDTHPENAGSAHIFVMTVPSAPAIEAITPGEASFAVAFTAGGNGGSPITNYAYSTDGGGTWAVMDPAKTNSPLTLTRTSSGDALVNGIAYQVRIRAINAIGDGAASNTVAAELTGKNAQQLRPGAAPKRINGNGVTVINKRNAKTRQGQPVRAHVKRIRGDLNCYRIQRGPQRNLHIRTYGACTFKLQVRYTAPGNSGYKPLKVIKNYRVTKR